MWVATIQAVTEPGRYAVIPTRNRPHELTQLVNRLHADGAHPIVIDNGSTPPAAPPAVCTVVVEPQQPPNLARFWNLGFEVVAELAADAGHDWWDIGVLNDDAVIPPGWFDAVTTTLRTTGAAAACSDPYGTMRSLTVKYDPDRDVTTRMCPWAFILRGELGFRADESMAWWFQDTDADWWARANGGMAIVPGYLTQNTHANTTTVGALAEQAGRDRQAFAAKHGWVPW